MGTRRYTDTIKLEATLQKNVRKIIYIIELLISFYLVTRSSSMNKQYYSQYHTLLYRIIAKMFDIGMSYKENADWLNDCSYATSRGKKFRNTHSKSIVKKKNLSDEKNTRLIVSIDDGKLIPRSHRQEVSQ